MKHNSPDILWNTVQLYLDNQLTIPERKEFEKQLEEDKELREMVDFFRNYDQQLEEENIESSSFDQKIEEHLQLLAHHFGPLTALDTIDKIIQSTPPGELPDFPLNELSLLQRIINTLKALLQKLVNTPTRILLMTLCLMSASYGGYQFFAQDRVLPSNSTPLPENLISKFKDYPFLFGGGDNSSEFERTVEENYTEGSYDEAAQEICSFLSLEENEDLEEEDLGYYGAMRLYQAISLIRLNELDSAITILNDLNIQPTKINTIEDRVIPFYLGFAHLLKGNKKEALVLLKNTITSDVKLDLDQNEIGSVSELLTQDKKIFDFKELANALMQTAEEDIEVKRGR